MWIGLSIVVWIVFPLAFQWWLEERLKKMNRPTWDWMTDEGYEKWKWMMKRERWGD